MEKFPKGERFALVFVLLISLGIVYYAGILTGKKISSSRLETKVELPPPTREVSPSSVTSVEFEVYGELLEKHPPPVTSPSPVTSFAERTTEQAVTTLPEEAEKKPSPPKVEKKKLASKPPVPSRDLYTVQVASYRTRAEAQKLLKILRSKGYSAYMVPAKVGGVIHYRVRVGEFRSASEAMKMKETIERNEKLKGFVTLKER